MSVLDNAKPEVCAPKIVQISADEYRLFALTDVGEVWEFSSAPNPGWERLPPLLAAEGAS